MKLCYDSVTAGDIPSGSEYVAGYVDGIYKWSDADWARFPNATKVRIAVFASTDDGVVGDVEDGCMTPQGALQWVRRRRAAGVDPTVYVNRANVDAVQAAFDDSGDPLPHLWLAHYDNVAQIPPSYIAKQYANAPLTGGHYDASVVADFWPGVDKEEAVVAAPKYFGQSADLKLAQGVVGSCAAAWDYGAGPKWITRKVWSHTASRFIVRIYPPVDPDADETQHLDAQPAIFVVDVSL